MPEIPEMTEEERKSAVVGMALGGLYGPLWFLEDNYGEDAVKKYQELNTKGQVEMMKLMGLDTPLKVLEFNAKTERHVLGSEVELEGDDDEATLKMKQCARLRSALVWARSGGSSSRIDQGRHCGLCLQLNYKAVAEALGFGFDVDFTPFGCEITYRKKE